MSYEGAGFKYVVPSHVKREKMSETMQSHIVPFFTLQMKTMLRLVWSGFICLTIAQAATVGPKANSHTCV